MAKILGIREVVGTGLSRDVQGYTTASPLEGDYALVPMGQGQLPIYDLNQPGRVKEIKDVLYHLAKAKSDSLQNDSDELQTEESWKYMRRSGEHADAWDGPTADAYVLAVSRYRDLAGYILEPPPFSQLLVEFQGGKTGVIGGPQPTIPGLEMLAQASRKLLGGSPQLSQYVQWRGGDLSSLLDLPPDAKVFPALKAGPIYDTRGWTLAWREGPVAKSQPQLVDELDLVEESLAANWRMAQVEPDEKGRQDRFNSIASNRSTRDQIVRQLNKGAPPRDCGDINFKWSWEQNKCVSRCPEGMEVVPGQDGCAVVLPELDITLKKPLSAGAKVAVVGGVAVGAYFLVDFLRKKKVF